MLAANVTGVPDSGWSGVTVGVPVGGAAGTYFLTVAEYFLPSRPTYSMRGLFQQTPSALQSLRLVTWPPEEMPTKE